MRLSQLSIPYTIHIHNLDNDSLLQIFSHYHLQDGDNWHIRHTWRRLAQVCQRWRYLIFHSSSHLDMCLLLTNDSPSIDTLSHLPPLPLVIDYSDRDRTLVRKDEDNIQFGLQRHGRVRRVALQAPSSTLHMFLQLMNKPFPRLGALSLLSTTTEDMSLVLPETLQVPYLNRLSLHGIGLLRGLSSLSSMIALSTLSLTHIQDSCYFPPGHLVPHLQDLPYLEELSIGFAIPVPLPTNEGEMLPPPSVPVTLSTLRRLTFRGVSVYLDNLVAQINTPLLEQIYLTLLFEVAFTLVNLTEFIHRTEGFECLIARVIFNKDSASIDASIGKFGLHVDVICQPFDWQIDSTTQVCSALGKVMSTVEELTLDLYTHQMPSDWENRRDNMMWHEFLVPFIGVMKLHIGSSLTLELHRALESVTGGLVMELLPELKELDVQLGLGRAGNMFSEFFKAREFMGRPVYVSEMAPLQSSHKRDLLYTDGYIVRMFGASEAPLYITRLLQFNERLLQLHVTPETGIFIVHPAVLHARPSTYISNRPAWLLDYIVQRYGSVVPQTIWTPATKGDAQRYNKVYDMPIFLVHSDRKTLGLRLVQAAAGNGTGLLNAHAPAPFGSAHTICIRVKWPGYDEQARQIMIRDQTRERNTISLETLAARVARAVCRFLEVLEVQPCQDLAWRVGGRGGITADNVILIGLIRVSQGSWQLILQLDRYIISSNVL